MNDEKNKQDKQNNEDTLRKIEQKEILELYNMPPMGGFHDY